MIYEFQRIIDTYRQTDFTLRRAALATVVDLKGSGYRRPGARMLITDDGHWTGAISGGCLEGDALRKAREVMRTGEARLVTYDTTDPDGENFGIGLGCHGVLTVLLQLIDHADADNPIERLARAIRERKPVTFVTPLPGDAGKPFVEELQPDIQLLVFGAGYDAVPLVRQAKLLGWRVVVTDDCVAHLNPKRFADADELLTIPRDQIGQQMPIDQFSAAVLISHNYKYDLAVMRQLLATPIPYIGLLGPRRRGEALVTDLGDLVSTADTDRIFAPVGLDLGGETPQEIALSIVAEIQTAFRGFSGRPLREKEAPIHQVSADLVV